MYSGCVRESQGRTVYRGDMSTCREEKERVKVIGHKEDQGNLLVDLKLGDTLYMGH